MPCTITDFLYYYSNALSPQALENQQILAVPASETFRISISSQYRIMSVNPDITTAAYKFGISATTDATGQFSLTLPYGDAETKPVSPSPKWSLVFPDGRILTGVVPSIAGPTTLDTLISTYSWEWNTEVYVAPVTPGTLARGTALFAASNSASVVFSNAFAANTYILTLTPSVDTDTDAIPQVAWANKTRTGFDISVSGLFTGQVDWEAVL